MDYLDSDIKFLAGVGDKRAALLRQEMGVHTFGDLLYYFPFRYVDRSRVAKIAEIAEDQVTEVQIRARVTGMQAVGEGPRKRLVVFVDDGSGRAELVWFRGVNWMQKQLEPGREYIIFGKPAFFMHNVSMVHPEVDSVSAEASKMQTGVRGVYPMTEKLGSSNITSKTIYNLMRTLWQQVAPHIRETLPARIVLQNNLMPLKEALYNIHFPASEQALLQARWRLKFEELFLVQLSILMMRNNRIEKGNGFVFERVGEYFNRFYTEKLPFEMTRAQKRVVREIRKDTLTGRQMNRLLQGDVGSGKTIVALMGALLAKDNGFQSCIMAPTEILAGQHYESIAKMLNGMGVTVALLTGSTRKPLRRIIDRQLRGGELDILIGTHALIEDTVQFNNLGFVVIDEQHRFGVEQRSRLWAKNMVPPHVLVMTATPIPRTLAMTLYGDLDVSVIDELPPGRKPIKTIHAYDAHRLRVFGFIREEIKKGRQVYIVYPLIRESEKLDYKDLEDGYAGITAAFPYPEYHTVVVHGQMSSENKEYGMNLFKTGQAHIMAATSVIEVGVNVPNASIMIVESAERFGLSQLHQLRGRVGRGSEQSYCILMTKDRLSKESRKRIEAMVATNDGFELAELDMQLRGPGDMEGTRQSGLGFDLKIANLAKDVQLMEQSRAVARDLLGEDPELSHPENAMLRNAIARVKKVNEVDFSRVL